MDDGDGITPEKSVDMFSNYRANHTDDQSIGSIGIGAKLANAFISKYQHDSTILTKSKNGDFHLQKLNFLLMLKIYEIYFPKKIKDR